MIFRLEYMHISYSVHVDGPHQLVVVNNAYEDELPDHLHLYDQLVVHSIFASHVTQHTNSMIKTLYLFESVLWRRELNTNST